MAADTALGPEFRGTVAPTLPRVLAFAIDVVLTSIVATAVALVSGSIALGALTVIELAIGFWVMQARTGATVGQRLLRLRVSRNDAPFSPGAIPSFIRFALTGAGFAMLGLGSWLIVASSAFDPARRLRGFGDRASRTIVVAVPTSVVLPEAATVVAPPVVTSSALAPPPGAPPAAGAPAAGAPLVLAAPQLINTKRPSTPLDEASASAVPPAPPAPSAPTLTQVPVLESVASLAPAEFPVEPAYEPGYETVAVQRPAPARGGALLLIFDTGQREQVSLPTAINLGRKPTATELGDTLISVNDPDGTVSKNHARIEHQGGVTYVIDGGSTNGTEVISDEGQVALLSVGVRTPLDDGSRVRLGKRTLTVSVLLEGSGS